MINKNKFIYRDKIENNIKSLIEKYLNPLNSKIYIFSSKEGIILNKIKGIAVNNINLKCNQDKIYLLNVFDQVLSKEKPKSILYLDSNEYIIKLMEQLFSEININKGYNFIFSVKELDLIDFLE